MRSRATTASSTWNESQLIDIFYSLLAASICCHRGRHRCDTSHPCRSPTYTRSVFEGGLFEVLRPSVRGTPSLNIHSEGLLLRVGALPCAPTYNRGVVQHVVFNRLELAQPHECSSKAATCHANSTYCASGLQQHLVICTEDVTAARRTLQRLQIFSWDTTASSTSSNPRMSAN